MISNLTIAGLAFTILASLIVVSIPLLWIYIKSKDREVGIWGAFALGATAFIWTQIFLRMPLQALILQIPAMKNFSKDNYVAYILVASIFMAAFATLGRVWAVWLTNKKNFSYYRGMSVGIGYPAFQIIGTVLFTYYSYLIYAVKINHGSFDQYAARKEFNVKNIANIKSVLTETNPIDFFLTGYQSIITVAVQLAFLCILLKFSMKNKMIWGALISTAVSALYSFITVILTELSNDKLGHILSGKNSSILCYLFMTIAAIVAVWYVIREYRIYVKSIIE